MSIDAIRDLVRSECFRDSNRFGPAFFDQHLETVVRYGRELAVRLGADPEVVELAGYLHDLSAVRDLESVPTHHLDGARIARELLLAHGWPLAVADSVCRCIESHSAPVAKGQGTPEEVCLSNADVMSHIARPAYWFFYLYRVRGMQYGDGVSWLRTRVERLWSGLTEDARAIVATEYATAVRILEDPPPRADTPSEATMPCVIRHAEPEDHGPIIAVVNDWWSGRAMTDMLPRLFFIHFRPTSFVAEAAGRVVGFVAGFRSQTHREQAYIHFAGVDPACRGAGVGRSLYERFFEAARRLGCTEVHCVTSPANGGSLAFHAAMGFEVLPGTAGAEGEWYVADYDGPGESRVRLRKRI